MANTKSNIKIFLLIALMLSISADIFFIGSLKITPPHLIRYHETHCVVEKYWSNGSISKVIRPGRECDGYEHDIARY